VIDPRAGFRRPPPVLAGLVVGANLNSGLAVASGALLYCLLDPEMLGWFSCWSASLC